VGESRLAPTILIEATTSKPQTFCKRSFAADTSAKVHNGVLLQKSDAVVVNFCEL
jgi:hypothetical protein